MLGLALAESVGELRSLNVADCQLRGKAVTAICRSLASCQGRSKLRRLKMYKNEIGDAGAKALSDFLLLSKQLRYLDISETDLTDEQAKILATGFAQCSSLSTLRICENPFQSAGAVALFDAFPTDGMLRKLHLNECRIGDEGGEAAGRFIRRSQHICCINFIECEIPPRGVKAIADAVAGSDSISDLGLEGSRVGDEVIEYVVEKMIVRNRSLRRLGMCAMNMEQRGAKAVASAVMGRTDRKLMVEVDRKFPEIDEAVKATGCIRYACYY